MPDIFNKQGLLSRPEAELWIKPAQPVLKIKPEADQPS